LICFTVAIFNADPRRHSPSQHGLLVSLDAPHHQLSTGFWITQNGAVTTTPSSSKVGSRNRCFSSFSFVVSSVCFPASFSGDSVHRFQPPRSHLFHVTSLLLNVFCFAQKDAQIRRGYRFKICALSLSTGDRCHVLQFVVSFPSVNAEIHFSLYATCF
jgi:hypothetical protein